MMVFFWEAGVIRLRTERAVPKVRTSISSVHTVCTSPAWHSAAHCASASDGAYSSKSVQQPQRPKDDNTNWENRIPRVEKGWKRGNENPHMQLQNDSTNQAQVRTDPATHSDPFKALAHNRRNSASISLVVGASWVHNCCSKSPHRTWREVVVRCRGCVQRGEFAEPR